MSLFSLYSQRIVLPDIEFALGCCFLLALEKCWATSSAPPWFLTRHTLSFELLFLNRLYIIFSVVVLKIFFAFSSPKFIDMPWCRFLWVFHLKFVHPLESVGLCLLINLESFQSLFLWIVVQPYNPSHFLGFWWYKC